MASCVIEDVTDEFDPTSFDKQLGALLIECKSDASLYLTTVLDFLKRKSNFFKQGNAKQRVLEAYRQVSGEQPAVSTGGMKGGFLASKPSKTSAAAAPAKKVRVRPVAGGWVHGMAAGSLQPSAHTLLEFACSTL